MFRFAGGCQFILVSLFLAGTASAQSDTTITLARGAALVQAGKTAFDKFRPTQRFTAMGQMLEVATPDEAAKMLADLPAPVRLVWRLVGRRRYARYVATFRR